MCIILFLFSTINTYSQKPVFTQYTAENGLPHDITYQIIQDSQGFIWIGTDDGLAKFNGDKFITYSYEDGLKSNFVIDIVEKAQNEFLLATWGAGLHALKKDSIIKLPIDNDNSVSKIKKLYPLSDSIILSPREGSFYIYDLNKKEKKEYHIGKNKLTQKPMIINGISTKNQKIYGFNQCYMENTLYLFAKETGDEALKGIYILENNKLHKKNYPHLNNVEVHALTKKNDTLFASSFNKLYIYKKRKLIEEKEIDLKDGKISNIQVIDNNLYFVFINYQEGTRNLYKYNLENNILKNISFTLGINSMISDFMFDKDSNLWITTYGQGVFYVSDFSNSFFDSDFFSNPDLKDISCSDKHILAIAPNTIYKIENDSLKNTKNTPFHVETFTVNEKTKQIHLVTYLQYNFKARFLDYYITTKSSKEYNFSSSSKSIKIKKNTISVYKNDTLYSTKIVHNKDEGIKKAILYKDKIYVIYNKLGVYVFDCNTGKKIEQLDSSNGYYTNQFKDIIIKNDTIWLASNVGVIKIIKNNKTRYTTKNGLVSNHINDIHIDKHERLWIATQKGLNVSVENNFYTIDKSLGQQSSFITKIVEHNNYIYATGNNGLFKLNNVTPFKPKENTELLITQKDTQFTLNTINYVNANSIELAYQLDSNPWVITTNTLLNFKGLKRGKHQLAFKFKDNLSKWKFTKTHTFYIIVPWYNQIWFYSTIIAMIFGSIIFLSYHLLQKSKAKNKVLANTIHEREKLRNELNQVRANVAQDFHDELGNKLASISILSKLLSNKTKTEPLIHKKVTQINKDAKALYSGMRDFVWAIDHNSDNLIELIFYLNNFGEELFKNTNILFITDNNCNPEENIILPYYWSKQLVLIFKEAMTNCLKHSKATEAKLLFLLEGDQLHIYFKDNGIGYKNSELVRKNGLLNMQQRVGKINEKLQITTNKGVQIHFIGLLKK